MSRSHNLKAQEAEGPEESGSIVSVLVETDEDVIHLKLLLCKFQQNSEAIFAPVGECAGRDLDVQVVIVEHGSPVHLLAIC